MILVNFSYSQYIMFFVLLYFIIFIDTLFSYLASVRIPNYYKAEYLPWNKLIFKWLEGKIWIVPVVVIINWVLVSVIMLMPIKIAWVVFLFGFFFTRALQGLYRFIMGWLLNGQRT